VVKAESQLEQEAAFEHSARNSWVANSAKQDCVVLLEALHVSIVESLAGGVVAASAKVVLGGYKVHTGTAGCQLKRLKRNVGYLWANAISTNNGELVFTSQLERSCKLYLVQL
jgi:hypothetical protein